MTREEHIEKIDEIVKDNQCIKTMLGEQNNLLSRMRDYTSADVKEAYNRGYDEGKGQAWSDEIKKYEIEPEKEREAYQRGLNEMWDIVRHLWENGTIDFSWDLGWSAEKILEEYQKWKKDAIKVGDEVLNIYDNTMAVILDEVEEDHDWHVYTENGCVEKWCENVFRGTGRTYPQIEEVLKAMRKGADNE